MKTEGEVLLSLHAIHPHDYDRVSLPQNGDDSWLKIRDECHRHCHRVGVKVRKQDTVTVDEVAEAHKHLKKNHLRLCLTFELRAFYNISLNNIARLAEIPKTEVAAMFRHAILTMGVFIANRRLTAPPNNRRKSTLNDNDITLSEATAMVLQRMAQPGIELSASSYYEAAQTVRKMWIRMEEEQNAGPVEIKIDAGPDTRSSLLYKMSELDGALIALGEKFPTIERTFSLHMFADLRVGEIARLLNKDALQVVMECRLGRHFVIGYVEAERRQAIPGTRLYEITHGI